MQQFLSTPCFGCGWSGLLHLLESVTNALSYGSETTTIRRMPKIKVRSECYGYVIILHVRGVLREYPLLSDAHFPENDEYIHTTWVIILFVGMQGCGRPQRQISRGGYSRFSLCSYDTSIVINRLGRVPEAQRKKESMGKLVYHYTDMNAFVGIVGGYKNGEKESAGLTFWATRYDGLNDPHDYLFASTVVLPKIRKAIMDLDNQDEEVVEDVESYPYIVSFSENRDSDFMWKHYKADICLELDSEYFTPWIKENGRIKAFCDKCVYAEEDEIDDAFIEKWKNSLIYLKNINDMARHASVYIKRAAFKDEKEWRLYVSDGVQSQFKYNGESYINEIPQDVKVKCVRDKDIILYKEFNIPKEALKGVIVNNVDLDSFQKVKRHIKLLLTMKGFFLGDIYIQQTNRYPL